MIDNLNGEKNKYENFMNTLNSSSAEILLSTEILNEEFAGLIEEIYSKFNYNMAAFNNNIYEK